MSRVLGKGGEEGVGSLVWSEDISEYLTSHVLRVEEIHLLA